MIVQLITVHPCNAAEPERTEISIRQFPVHLQTHTVQGLLQNFMKIGQPEVVDRRVALEAGGRTPGVAMNILSMLDLSSCLMDVI